MKKSVKIVLCIALVLCLVSMIGTAAMQSNWGKASVKTHYVTTAELAGMIRDNNAATGKDIQVTFTEDPNAIFCFMTMIPKTATAENPAPAVICIHGGANTKEMQLNGYIELVRRGFVVISMDMAEHGHSYAAINGLTQESYGALAAVEYAMSLPCVDETKIGVTGHSMGNQACYYAIAALNTEESTQRIASWVEGMDDIYDEAFYDHGVFVVGQSLVGSKGGVEDEGESGWLVLMHLLVVEFSVFRNPQAHGEVDG